MAPALPADPVAGRGGGKHLLADAERHLVQHRRAVDARHRGAGGQSAEPPRLDDTARTSAGIVSRIRSTMRSVSATPGRKAMSGAPQTAGVVTAVASDGEAASVPAAPLTLASASPSATPSATATDGASRSAIASAERPPMPSSSAYGRLKSRGARSDATTPARPMLSPSVRRRAIGPVVRTARRKAPPSAAGGVALRTVCPVSVGRRAVEADPRRQRARQLQQPARVDRRDAGVHRRRQVPCQLGERQLPVGLVDCADLRPRCLHQRLLVLDHDARAEAGDDAVDRGEVELGEPIAARHGRPAALAAGVQARSDDRQVGERARRLAGAALDDGRALDGVLERDDARGAPAPPSGGVPGGGGLGENSAQRMTWRRPASPGPRSSSGAPGREVSIVRRPIRHGAATPTRRRARRGKSPSGPVRNSQRS